MNRWQAQLSFRAAWAMVLLVVLTLLVYGDVLFSPGVLYGQDIIDLGYPLAYFRHKAIAAGEAPIWNPYMMCGFPQMSSAPFYPTDYIDRFFSMRKVPVVRYAFQTLMAGLLMYLLLRRFRLSSTAAILGAIVFMFSGFFMSKVYAGHGGAFSSGVWIPLTFLCLDRLIDTRRLRDAVLLGGAVGLQLLGEHAQYVFYTLLAAALYAAFKLWPVCIRRLRLRTLLHYGALAGWAALFALMTSAVFLLPFRELTAMSNRAGGTSYAYASSLSLPPANLLTVLFPNIWGTPAGHNAVFGALYWDGALYIGLVPLLLMLAAIRWAGERTARFFKWMIVGAIVLALGEHTPIYWLVYHIPGFSMVRAPSKILFIYAFAAAILSAYGLEVLLLHLGNLRAGSVYSWLSPEAKRIVRLFRTAAVVCVAAFAAFFAARPIILRAAGEIILRSRENPERYLAKLNSLYATQFASVGLAALFAVLAAVIVGNVLTRRISARAAAAGLVVLSFLDLMLYADPLVRPARLEQFYGFNKQQVDFLKRDRDVFRILPVEASAFRYTQGVLTGLENVNGYYPIISRRYGRLAQAIDGRSGELDVSADIGNYRSNLLDMLNVKYVLSRNRLSAPNLTLVRSGPINVYLNNTVLPRAFLVRNVQVARDGDEALRLVTSPSFDPRETLVLESRGETLEPAPANARESVRIIRPKLTRVTVIVDAASPAYLFMSDQYDPRWRVYIDGKRTGLLPANYAFRAVRVPAGKHTITMIHNPTSRRIGFVLSSVAYLIILGVLMSLWLESASARTRKRLKERRAQARAHRAQSG